VREILFKGKRVDNGEWVEGLFCKQLIGSLFLPCIQVIKEWDTGDYIEHYEVNPETVSQFTGLLDKSGKQIFEGDIVEFYTLKRFTQQSFDELPPEIDELIIKKHCKEVEFLFGAFTIKEYIEIDIGYLSTLTSLGLDSVDGVKDAIFGEKRKTIYSEDEMECDMDETEINESIIGIKVIGNIHDDGITNDNQS
jgi:uncharacterized phage protein (TIGR01671 family)